jgi:hypothetical protein
MAGILAAYEDPRPYNYLAPRQVFSRISLPNPLLIEACSATRLMGLGMVTQQLDQTIFDFPKTTLHERFIQVGPS